MQRIKCDKIILGDRLFDGFVYLDGDKILEVTDKEYPAEVSQEYHGYLSSGFIDLHTHGGGGHAFMNSSPEEVAKGCNFHLKHGTTSILPTVSAGYIPTMEKALSDIATAQKKHLAASNLLGAHLEGPYLSTKQCGAQGVSFITAPKKEDYTRLVEEYGKYIARWTYAPERDDGTFCRYLTEHGILASAGHTDAEYSDMLTAMQNGCSLVTHLYSCTSTVTRHMGFRHLGVIETAFLCDDLNVEIIADGRHLPKELVQLIVKIKGADHVALITDSLELAGTDVKEGVMNGTEFLVEDGVCKLKDRTAFAGSIATADRLVRFLSGECGFGIPTAVKMMTEVPARLLSCKKGQIKAGYDADLVVFNENIELSAVYVGGKQVNLNSI